MDSEVAAAYLAEEAKRQAERDIADWKDDLEFDRLAEIETWEARDRVKAQYYQALFDAVNGRSLSRYAVSPSGLCHRSTCAFIPAPQDESIGEWLKSDLTLKIDAWTFLDGEPKALEWAQCCASRLTSGG